VSEPGINVVIDARISSGEWGGVESVVIGLAAGLSRLDDGNERYLFLAHEGQDAWIKPYLSGSCDLLSIPPTVASSTRHLRRRIKMVMPWLARAWGLRPSMPGVPTGPPRSDGTVERAGADVVHFTTQSGFLTSIPSIYHPHDLQHVHLPQFFTPAQRRWRALWYGALSRQATMVAVASSWTKADVEKHLDLVPDKVVVVPLAPPIIEYPEPDRIAVQEATQRLRLPPEFILYPAQTWPHKNHIALLDALHLVSNDRGLKIPLVLTGQLNEFYPTIAEHAKELGLTDQIVAAGFVSPKDLRAIYKAARAVVIPSRFEAASAPLWEAFRLGVPAACSNVTSLPEQAGDAALIFDPDRPDQIAAAIQELWQNTELRERLIRRGLERVEPFTWERTARTFRAHYRRLMGRSVTEEDRGLLSRPPGI
jgi:glycosyltransferase involved in cell wall biosynthesis